MKNTMTFQRTFILLFLLSKFNPRVKSLPCSSTKPLCKDCDEKNKCLECVEGKFLDIKEEDPKCEDCPSNCTKCDKRGCVDCIKGSFIKEISYFGKKSDICNFCSINCLTCRNTPTHCTECKESYEMDLKSYKCVYKYTHLIAISIVFVLLLLFVAIFVFSKCLCEESKAEEKTKYKSNTKFGTILDKDPDLRSDYYKTEVKTIGLNQESFFSEVQQREESLMNITNASRDHMINGLLGTPNQNPVMRSEFGDEGTGFDFGESINDSFVRATEGNQNRRPKTFATRMN